MLSPIEEQWRRNLRRARGGQWKPFGFGLRGWGHPLGAPGGWLDAL